MRTNAILAGLALMLGLAAPVAAVAAEPPDMSPAADEGTGSGGNRPGMHAPGHQGGWQRHMGQRGRSHGHHRPSFIGMLYPPVQGEQEQRGPPCTPTIFMSVVPDVTGYGQTWGGLSGEL